jgi:citrate lyase subunit beta/citryl-CoA lyase
VAAVRVNPLELDGMEDLAAVMRGRPDIVALPKVAEPFHVVRLDEAVTRLEREYGIPEGSTALLPNIEFARGLVQLSAIAKASPRVSACLLAAEDLAADLGAERAPDGIELSYCRQRFIVECVAVGVVAVDCPYTWSDIAGVERDTRWARRLGYGARSLVEPAHAAVINHLLTPDDGEMRRAREIVAAFETARAKGEARVEIDGSLVEVPTYANARRLLARGEALREFERSR